MNHECQDGGKICSAEKTGSLPSPLPVLCTTLIPLFVESPPPKRPSYFAQLFRREREDWRRTKRRKLVGGGKEEQQRRQGWKGRRREEGGTWRIRRRPRSGMPPDKGSCPWTNFVLSTTLRSIFWHTGSVSKSIVAASPYRPTTQLSP